LSSELPAAPDYEFTPREVDQRYHIEIWAEKSTINDILQPLGREYGVNVWGGMGDVSLTRCWDLIQRARESGRPVRILYVSDFDPQGFGMPIGAARKIEFLNQQHGLDLDIQLRPVALTHDQTIQYRLPRTPVKDTTLLKGEFEDRFGEGATELDALEALHPGELRRILIEEIERYYDEDLDTQVEEVTGGVRDDLETTRDNVVSDHEDESDAIQAEYEAVIQEINAELDAVRERHGAQFGAVAARFNQLQDTIATDLRSEAPDLDETEWPEPAEGDEDDDPLFDSTRDYVEQIDRYKEHQDRPTCRKERRDKGRSRNNYGGPRPRGRRDRRLRPQPQAAYR
jgi:hypothetical protein